METSVIVPTTLKREKSPIVTKILQATSQFPELAPRVSKPEFFVLAQEEPLCPSRQRSEKGEIKFIPDTYLAGVGPSQTQRTG